MSAKIARLPDFVASQIAAGEVVQRPASVVKELLENAIDAGSTSVIVSIKEGGRELIQVIDDGEGMSFGDAATAFERHATSKITAIDGLFALQTFGFRGEALPSIASVAEVELKTRREDAQLGTRVAIHGGQRAVHEEIVCPKGSQFAVRNLFYNIPARRKFLKKDTVEARHVVAEFQRVALCHPKTAMFFYNNDACVYNLPSSNLRQRIAALMGRHLSNQLIDVFAETSIVKLHGFIGKPDAAKKSPEQFFFVNGRYFRSPYFHKAVVQAFQKLLPATDVMVPYFLYFTVDPARIDVNIHPSKTEVKFDEEQAVWQIVLAAVKESLGKYGVVPMIDFDAQDRIDIPVLNRAAGEYRMPSIDVNPAFNPFDEEFSFSRALHGGKESGPGRAPRSAPLDKWGTGFETEAYPLPEKDGAEPFSSVEAASGAVFENEIDSGAFASDEPVQGGLEVGTEGRVEGFFAVSDKYVAARIGGRVLFVDVQRAAFRVAYERFLKQIDGYASVTQREMFPLTVDLSPADFHQVMENRNELSLLGFDIAEGEKEYAVVLQGVPAWAGREGTEALFQRLLDHLREETTDRFLESRRERLALGMAAVYRTASGETLPPEKIGPLLEDLLECTDSNYSPDGRPIYAALDLHDIAQMLK